MNKTINEISQSHQGKYHIFFLYIEFKVGKEHELNSGSTRDAEGERGGGSQGAIEKSI